MKRIKYNQCTSRLIEDLNLELTHRDDGHVKYHWMPRDRSVVYVAYLTHDEYCHDPLSYSDGSGRIITKHDDKAFLEHVGRDKDGEPVLDYFAALYARVKGVELDGFECDTSILLDMWNEASEKGTVGTLHAVALTYIDHRGYVEKTIKDHRHYWQADAVWIPDESLLEHINSHSLEERRKVARECFESALNEYNKWVTGDCWGVTVDEFTRVAPGVYERSDPESCWGFIGHDYALEEALSELTSSRKFFLANRVKKEHSHDHQNRSSGPAGENDRYHLGSA